MKIGLYLHFPFCLQKCCYCSFYSLPLPQNDQGKLAERYIDALEMEISLYAAYAARDHHLELSSIYCGGGTPTVIPTKYLCGVLSRCSSSFCLSDDLEVTVEANPGTVTLEKLQDLRRAGVNRLSLGAQSFLPGELELLGRTHSAVKIVEAYEAARAAGFDNINLDLIYALPGQNLASWRHNLEQALMLSPEHLSIYGLSLEEGTPLAREIKSGKLEACSEEMQIAMWEETAQQVISAGYVRYEISNYARPGRECRHNITYWKNTPYLGLGAAAQGCFEKVRYANESDLQRYLERVLSGELPRVFEEHQSQRDELIDTIIMGLRLSKGLSRKDFEQRFGHPFEDFYKQQLSIMVGEGLMGVSKDAIFLTDRGRLLANYVLSHFV
ncbi:MAG: radical SAM family heme chaperone HemW [Syntrophaceticus schinkii]|nr:radical SAM family heme chaperone HemW [Syntrophaceticus schinkii]MDD4260915.1 radical SAM family heme chaperone HemW [Syntrophaceticus schinkii]MDD4674265.1 radical SAM family heme chaperone HemW [Syntrophaceticus schinkii]